MFFEIYAFRIVFTSGSRPIDFVHSFIGVGQFNIIISDHSFSASCLTVFSESKRIRLKVFNSNFDIEHEFLE